MGGVLTELCLPWQNNLVKHSLAGDPPSAIMFQKVEVDQCIVGHLEKSTITSTTTWQLYRCPYLYLSYLRVGQERKASRPSASSHLPPSATSSPWDLIFSHMLGESVIINLPAAISAVFQVYLYVLQKRHHRTFSEDDRIQAQENVKKVEDDDAGDISEPEDPLMLHRDAKDWKVCSTTNSELNKICYSRLLSCSRRGLHKADAAFITGTRPLRCPRSL